MKLRTPSAPFKRIDPQGESITIETEGKVLVLPTGHPYLLPKYNEFTLTEGRALPEAGTYTFTNDFETELGILNLNKNWIALYNSASNIINFFLFTHKPKKLQYVVSDIVGHINFQTADGEIFTTSDGNDFLVMGLDAYITSLILYPGNGLIYHGQITYNDLTRDSNSDLIPDFLDSSVLGSLSKFLQPYTTVDGTPETKQFLTADWKEFLTADGKYLFVRA